MSYQPPPPGSRTILEEEKFIRDSVSDGQLHFSGPEGGSIMAEVCGPRKVSKDMAQEPERVLHSAGTK